jgi:TetR/AcrR family transcriptional regulator of autoinduction and epiphytic fitness
VRRIGPRVEDDTDPRVERSRRVVRQAALEELAEVGYGAFSIESVAARCGVARSTIYRHWPGKLALVADALETLNEQPPPLEAPDDEPARGRVGRLVHHLADVFQDSIIAACIPALIEGAERDQEVREFHHGYSARRRQALVDAIARGVAEGDIAATTDPELAAIALSGAIIYRRVMTGEPFDPARTDDLVRTVLGEQPPEFDA